MKQEDFCGTMQRVQGYRDLVSGEHLILKYELSCFRKQTNFINISINVLQTRCTAKSCLKNNLTLFGWVDRIIINDI